MSTNETEIKKFSFGTVPDFDKHIEKSIRGYNNLLEDVIGFSKYFIRDNTHVVDLGCCTGKLSKLLMEENSGNATYIGYEIEPRFFPDLERLQEDENFNFYFEEDILGEKDFTKGPMNNMSFCTSLFTLQFMAPEKREEVYEKVYNALLTNGAFIIAEKIYSDDSKIQDMTTFMFYDHKLKSFTAKEISDKEKSLRHLLKPVGTLYDLTEELYNAGFERVECFWRNFNFVGLIAIK